MACKECGGNGGHHKPGCGMSPAVLQINNKDCTLFHGVTVPAIMGDETTNPPKSGLYKNVLLYYEASGNAYMYTSDGIPYKLTYATTDYNALTNKPTINGVTLEGNKTAANLGIVVNDGTLTLKQGGTTLGTFSANASENVEINIPGDSAGTELTVIYPEDSGETWSYVFGTLESRQVQLGGTNARVDLVGYEYIGDPYELAFGFGDDESYQLSEVFDLLESGEKITLNNVPLGLTCYASDYTIHDDIKANGVAITDKSIEESDEVKITTYSGRSAVVVRIGPSYAPFLINPNVCIQQFVRKSDGVNWCTFYIGGLFIEDRN